MTANALSAFQEDVLRSVFSLFGQSTFDLAQAIIPNYQPYQIRDALNEMVALDIVTGFPETKNVWELNDRGATLAVFLSFVIEKRRENQEKARLEAIANPKILRKLDKRDKWEMGHHYLITDLIAKVKEAGDSRTYEYKDEEAEWFVSCLYTDGSKYVLKLGVSLANLMNGHGDPRFTHVLLTYPNAEDK